MTEQVASQANEVCQAAVLFLDLDGSKKANDTTGHEADDRLSHIVAQRLSACVCQSDTLVRLGGDEFVMLLDNVHSLKEAECLAKRIVHSITQPPSTNGTKYYLGALIGTVLYPKYGNDVTMLLHCTDAAMCDAKQNGRN